MSVRAPEPAALHALPPEIVDRLICLQCSHKLHAGESSYSCSNPQCGKCYPVDPKEHVPILIDDAKSVFTVDDFLNRADTYYAGGTSGERGLGALLPSLQTNVNAVENYRFVVETALADTENPLVLVVGGSVLGKGMEEFSSNARLRFVETDVAFGPRTVMICDGHDLPFEDGTFDVVIAQAVLEHVVDPPRCVAEMHRVLKPGGLVYAETPFMQQVHAGAYDFTRFTHLGHRRLFRYFTELRSGLSCGPGSALAWSNFYFLLSFATSRNGRRLARLLAHLFCFWLKYFDGMLANRPGALDAASSVYFIGRRSETPMPDRELIAQYRGAM